MYIPIEKIEEKIKSGYLVLESLDLLHIDRADYYKYVPKETRDALNRMRPRKGTKRYYQRIDGWSEDFIYNAY